jgi:hypothetical protein
MPKESIDHIDFDDLNKRAISQPLVKHIPPIGRCPHRPKRGLIDFNTSLLFIG